MFCIFDVFIIGSSFHYLKMFDICVSSLFIVSCFFHVFRCRALSSRSLGHGLQSPNHHVSHLAGLSGRLDVHEHFFSLIYDARDVAPCRQNDTSRVQERLQLDYYRRRPTKRSSALSSHMHTSTVGNNHPSGCGDHAFERGCTSSFPPSPIYPPRQKTINCNSWRIKTVIVFVI